MNQVPAAGFGRRTFLTARIEEAKTKRHKHMTTTAPTKPLHTKASVQVAIYKATNADQIRNARQAWKTLDGSDRWSIYEALVDKETLLGLVWSKVSQKYARIEPVNEVEPWQNCRYNFRMWVMKTASVGYCATAKLVASNTATVAGKTAKEWWAMKTEGAK